MCRHSQSGETRIFVISFLPSSESALHRQHRVGKGTQLSDIDCRRIIRPQTGCSIVDHHISPARAPFAAAHCRLETLATEEGASVSPRTQSMNAHGGEGKGSESFANIGLCRHRNSVSAIHYHHELGPRGRQVHLPHREVG
jgi:hypothetical protein